MKQDNQISDTFSDSIAAYRPDSRKDRAVARWLLLGVAMLVIQIALGGLTRLTGSGLSITEWKPLLGALPPMSDAAWQEAFEKYKTIAQYKYLNAHFSLSDFKGIYFWEWMHREWARLVAVVFSIGFVYFLVRRYFSNRMIVPFIILFVLGALQGLIGWVMVKSGLNETDLYVSHIRLSIHFMSALVLLIYTLWFALQLRVPESRRIVNLRLHSYTIAFILMLCIQLIYGAFMAGLKIASAAPTWPKINSEWIPDNITTSGSRVYEGSSKFTSHPLAVHFIHRGLAYSLLLLAILWYLSASKVAASAPHDSLLGKARKWPLILIIFQVVLGILTVLNATHIIPGRFGAFEWLAEAHQLVAMCILVALFINLYSVKRK